MEPYDLSLLSLVVTLAVAVLGTVGTIATAWITVWPKLREQTAKALREEIAELRSRIDHLDAKLLASRTMEKRLLGILKAVLVVLLRYEPGTVDRIRSENEDLDL